MRIHAYNIPRYEEIKAAYRKYKATVDLLTERIAHRVPGIEKRKFRVWDLDHIIPIKYGFKNNIAPEKLAILSNLRVIPHEQNKAKGQKLTHPISLLECNDII